MAKTPDEPLTLTVHSLPKADAPDTSASTRAGRWKMLLLLLVCASPVIASYFTYYVIRPEGRRNYGELIDPQRPLPDLVGTDASGRPVPLPQLKNQWLFISVADSACDDACQKHLFLQRQLRETLGKDKDRLDWVWLRTGSPELSEPLKQATAAATVLHVDAAALATWLQPAAGQRLEDHLYVVDPIGNWMMRFPAQADPKQVKRDLDRLLRASAFWDKAGR
ncbi:SCO family protein [Hydrogenophaga luteola]|uniref:SCO family protein n=1 Tax=Hydrogenophaga luteola TaxID=1591122 RepID=A0ABV7W4P3_9BURK